MARESSHETFFLFGSNTNDRAMSWCEGALCLGILDLLEGL